MNVLRFAPTRFCWKEAAFAVRMISSVLFVLLALSGKASADDFIFNGTVNPMTGTYLPVGSGQYNHGNGSGEDFFNNPPTFPGVEQGIFNISKGFVPYDPSSSLGCLDENTQAGITYCYNIPLFYDASDGSLLSPFPLGDVMAIYDQAGDLLALMEATYPVDAGAVQFYTGIDGAQYHKQTSPPFLIS